MILYTLIICGLAAITCLAVIESRFVALIASVLSGSVTTISFFLLLNHREVLEIENAALVCGLSIVVTSLVVVVFRLLSRT